MKIKKWNSYGKYIEKQKSVSRRKKDIVWVKISVIDKIVEYLFDYYPDPISFGICHGVRTGEEVRLFQENLLYCEVIGTDVEPQKGVVEWDFNKLNPDWTGKFDFLYSNAFDHVYSPKETAGVWLNQLKPGGLAFVEWSVGHARENDPFAASLHEYMALFDKAGRLVDLIFCFPRKLHTLVVVGRK